MGCDIHGFWEFKTPDGAWIAFETVNDTRSYWWFGIIGGVRRPMGDLGTEKRGVPDDCSGAWRQQVDTWDRDFHSHTWLTPAEVKRANQMLFMQYKEEDDQEVCPDDLDDAVSYHETVPVHHMS